MIFEHFVQNVLAFLLAVAKLKHHLISRTPIFLLSQVQFIIAAQNYTTGVPSQLSSYVRSSWKPTGN